ASSTHKRQTVDTPTREVSGRYLCTKNRLLIQADAGLQCVSNASRYNRTSVSRRSNHTTPLTTRQHHRQRVNTRQHDGRQRKQQQQQRCERC
ncbi:hypothetical protein EJ02DRAFT_461130, partial [Clathrospora elynae]